MVTEVKSYPGYRQYRVGDGAWSDDMPTSGKFKMRVNQHPGQTKVWLSKKRFIFMQASVQVGKTCFGPDWLEREIREAGVGDYLAVTATFPLLENKMLPEMKLVFERIYNWGTYKAASRIFESHDRLRGAPASRIIVGSAANPESLESATAKAAWCDELGQHQFTRDAWDAVVRRLSLAQGRVLGTTTLYELGWYKTEIYDRWRQGAPDIDVIQVDALMNPAFPVEEYERAKNTMPRWKFNMFYRGVFEKPAGLIYDSFDESVCCIPRFSLPPNWPRYVGHDFGPNNTAAVWYAMDPDTGYLYVYRTYLEGGLSAYDHAQKFKALSQGEIIIKRVGGVHSEAGWREAFTQAGWPISEPREKSVDVGINTVYGWHQQNKLFVFNDLHRYLDEKLSYSWKLDENYEPTAEIANKSDYHLSDSERYLLIDFGPERISGNQTVKIIDHSGYGPESIDPFWADARRVRGKRRPDSPHETIKVVPH